MNSLGSVQITNQRIKVRIKPENNTKAKKRRLASKTFHWWLEIEEPRSKSRLAQLTKNNQRMRRVNPKSEFMVAAPVWDEKLQPKHHEN